MQETKKQEPPHTLHDSAKDLENGLEVKEIVDTMPAELMDFFDEHMKKNSKPQ